MDIEQKIIKVERKVKGIEEAIELLTKLTDSHNDRLFDSIKEDENLSEKINALVDAQIRTDDKIAALADAQTRTDDKIAALADAQNKTDDRFALLLEKLTVFADSTNQRLISLEK